MPLTPAFAVSVANPAYFGYDPADPSARSVGVILSSNGGMTTYRSGYNLADQTENDELWLGFPVADPTDENDVMYYERFFAHSSVHLELQYQNVEDDDQFLFVFGLKQGRRPLDYPAVAQFFLGTEFLRSEPIDDTTETIVLTVDSPGRGYQYLRVWFRIAGSDYWANAVFTGVEGFII